MASAVVCLCALQFLAECCTCRYFGQFFGVRFAFAMQIMQMCLSSWDVHIRFETHELAPNLNEFKCVLININCMHTTLRKQQDRAVQEEQEQNAEYDDNDDDDVVIVSQCVAACCSVLQCVAVCCH